MRLLPLLIILLSPLNLIQAQVLTPVQAVYDSRYDLNSIVVSPDGNHIYGAGRNIIWAFERENDGTLRLIDIVRDGPPDLSDPAAITISPDGTDLYVIHRGSSLAVLEAIATYSRNAATGQLTFIDVLPGGADGVEELRDSTAAATSPDGRHVYVTSNSQINAELHMALGGLTAFSRDEATGELTFLQAYIEGIDGVMGMSSPKFTVVSPDGKHVYVASFDGAIAVFARDEVTGELAFVEAILDGQNDVTHLEGAWSLVLAPDGAHLYVASISLSAIVIFARDEATGGLTFVESILDGQNDVEGIEDVRSIAMSEDGVHLYAVSAAGSMVSFARDGDTGRLTFVNAIFDAVDEVEGLRNATSLRVSPDGQQVYVGAYEFPGQGPEESSGAIVACSRDEKTGALTFVEAQFGDDTGIDGLTRVRSVAVTPAHVYTASIADAAVSIFSRDVTTGELTYVEKVREGLPLGVTWVTVSVAPDGANVYVTSIANLEGTFPEFTFHGGLAVFSREKASGSLTFVEAQIDGFNQVVGMDGPASATRRGLRSCGVHA